MKNVSKCSSKDGKRGIARNRPKRKVSSLVTMGLDLSLTGTGVVVLQDGVYLDHDLIATPSFAVEEVRFRRIWKRIYKMLYRYTPNIVMLESAVGGMTQHATHGLNAVIRYELKNHKVPFETMAPNTLKKQATGNGRSDKPQMLAAAQVHWPECPDHNCADAYHLAVQAMNVRLESEGV
jgi:Holliday junction resolvasome RuvABC endonuclease subunit